MIALSFNDYNFYFILFSPFWGYPAHNTVKQAPRFYFSAKD